METNRDDRVIASVRTARDAYAAMHGHDLSAIFKDIRAAQEAAGHAYVRHVEPPAKAIIPGDDTGCRASRRGSSPIGTVARSRSSEIE